ncbi:MAG: elongation factor Ts [candidate division WS1 bacterium]|jgi:elongation factor Ts|nr:elongation factor Ts [candidate division WS1 bacterium]
MAVSSADVMKLRQITGAGMLDCKRALEEAGGDLEKAVDYLRKKGVEVAAKRETKSATEGVIASYVDGKGAGAVVEVNCETDFAARSEDFRQFCDTLARQIVHTQASGQSVEDLLAAKSLDNESLTVDDLLSELTAKLGERVLVRRFVRYAIDDCDTGDCQDETTQGLVASYIHAGEQIGVLLEINCATDAAANSPELAEFARNIAMQIAAMQPRWVAPEDVPQEAIDREREVLTEQAVAEGKPENIAAKMVEGRLKKFYSQTCLLNQPYIRDDALTIEELLSELTGRLGDEIIVRRFARYQVGEDL